MASTYIDCFQYQRQPSGLAATLPNYIGNIGRLSNGAIAGASSLSISATTIAQVQYDSIYIFDGPNSEVVQVGSAGANVAATSFPLQAVTQYAHAAGTPYCTDGASGSLGEQIFTASQWIEDDICFQALWSTAYTNEILTMPTMRAALDNRNNLHFRPRHFPITALTSISIQANQLYSATLDPTQAIIDSDQQTIDIPNINLLSSGGLPPPQGYSFVWQAINRQSNAWITIAYTAGYAPGQLPRPITRACSLLTSEMFTQLENPIGADSIQQGKSNVAFVLKGDLSGESLLVKQAKQLLSKYTIQAF